MISDKVRFTEGDCWILMKKLHRLTGWPCFAFGMYDSEEDAVIPDIHGFVQRPDSLFLDVEGLSCRQEMHDKYQTHARYDIVTFDIKEFAWATPDFGKHSYRRARAVADALLDKYGAPWYSPAL